MASDDYILSALAKLCSDGISTHLGKTRYDWNGQVDTKLALMLGLKDSKSRLDEWIQYLEQARLNISRESSAGPDDSMVKLIGRSLLLLLMQLRTVTQLEIQGSNWTRMQELVNTILGDDANQQPLEERMFAYGFQHPTSDPQKAEEAISDLVTCLCSYKTALRIMSSHEQPSGSSQDGQLLTSSSSIDQEEAYCLPDFEFEAGPLERAESDIFERWRQWEFGKKSPTDPVAQIIGSTAVAKNSNVENDVLTERPFDSASNHHISTPNAESSKKTQHRKSKHSWSRPRDLKQIEPPPPYHIAASDPTPPLGYTCWIGSDLNEPPAYAKAVKEASAQVERKLVIVGDGATGKTCANIVFLKGKYPEVYVPTIFDNYYGELEIDSIHVGLAVFDTAGQEDFDRLRPLSYPDSDVIVITYCIDSLSSLEDVVEKWIHEVVHYCAGTPVLLVGLKADLRDDERTVQELKKQSMAPVNFRQGLKAANTIGAQAFVECSALTGKGIREMYSAAARLSLSTTAGPKKEEKCSVM